MSGSPRTRTFKRPHPHCAIRSSMRKVLTNTRLECQRTDPASSRQLSVGTAVEREDDCTMGLSSGHRLKCGGRVCDGKSRRHVEREESVGERRHETVKSRTVCLDVDVTDADAS